MGRATAERDEIERVVMAISIHALRGEGDAVVEVPTAYLKGFQSTPSVGRATAKIYKYAMLCLYIVHIKLYIFATAVLFTWLKQS